MWISSRVRKPRIIAVSRRLTEDLLFWEQLGRRLKPSPESPLLIFHGPGEVTERILEGDGLAFDSALSTDNGRRALEDAFRTENRQAAAALTEAGVPAVALMGTDRRLLTGASPRFDLLSPLAASGTVPVLGLLAVEGRLPGLAAVVEASNEAVSGVDWVVSRAVGKKISPAELGDLSGEDRAPDPSKMGRVSIRVLGVSEVGLVDPNSGSRLT